MSEEKKMKEQKPQRQEWHPNWFVFLLYKLWTLAFGLFKIALGAAVTVALICIICGAVFAGALGDYLQNDVLPNALVDMKDNTLEQSSVIYYVDGNDQIQILQDVYSPVFHKWATYEEIPEDLIHAAVAIEDKRFFEHQGVDWITTVKACTKMFFGDASMGGSTITQQMIKNRLHDDSITVQRKVREIFRATQYERTHDKKDILEWYMNVIYLGEGCTGAKAAAATYFGKELETLTTAECASLISITNNPSMYDPYIDPEANRARQLIVLGQMLEQGWIDQQEYNQAVAQEMVFKNGIAPEDRYITCEKCGYRGPVKDLVLEGDTYYCPDCHTEIPVTVDSSKDVYSWFVETVLEDVAKSLADMYDMEWSDSTYNICMEMIKRNGYHIYSTLDMEVQNQIDRIYEDLDEIPTTRSRQQLQSAIAVVDNRTGDIVGISGGVGQKVEFDAFNRATEAELQTGSCIKPLTVYAPGFESGLISPATVVPDMPITYDGGPYPLNDVRSYSYRSTIFEGVVESINAVAANTLEKIGVEYSFDFAKNKFGISGLVESYDTGDEILSDIAVGPLALGAQTVGVSVRDMSCGFATFANNGVYRKGRTFTKVYDSEGKLIIDNPQESREILSSKTVNYMNYCLNTAVYRGTGTAAWMNGDIDMDVYGKTGTSGDDKDRWFCGYTGYYTAAVWCGYDQPETIRLTGSYSNPAARLWKKVMLPLHEDKENVQLFSTYGMVKASMCLDSGKIATENCKKDIRGIKNIQEAWVYPEDLTMGPCDKHVKVEYCTKGHGVATEYCKLFEEAEKGKYIEEKSLVKMTQEELDEILKAEQYGVSKDYLRDDYIYLVTEDGRDAEFHGFKGNANKDVKSPYIVCPVHTKEAWEKYQKEHEAVKPLDPSAPTEEIPPVIPPHGDIGEAE